MKELDERGDVTCIAWTTNICSKASTARDGAVGKTQSVWKQILEEERAQWKNGGEGAVELDLPRDLTLLDVESCLPKLSTLPSGAYVFSALPNRRS